MSETYPGPSVASYRDTVMELMRAGEPFGEVEDVIEALADLTLDQRTALWLFAFSLRALTDPPEQHLGHARPQLYAVE
jgi:hypothetical protein